MASNVVEVTDATFEAEVVQSPIPVVVDFWAPWCGPCRMLSPALEKVTREANGAFTLAKINTDDNQQLARDYGVQGIPAVKLFRNGKVVGEFVGARPEPQVRDFIKTYLPAPTDAVLAAAQALIDEGRLPQAELALRELLAKQPNHAEAALTLGQVLLHLGRGAEAEEALQRVPADDPLAVTAEKLQPLARFMAAPNEATEGLDALYQTAADLARQHLYTEALDVLLDVLRKNRTYRNGEVKAVMLALLELLGKDEALVKTYQRRLATVLF